MQAENTSNTKAVPGKSSLRLGQEFSSRMERLGAKLKPVHFSFATPQGPLAF